MKRSTLYTTCCTALLLMAMAFSTPAQAQIGIAGGLNFNQLDDINTGDTDATFENSTGYHIGVFYDAGLGPIAIRPGIFYREIGQYQFGSLPGPNSVAEIELSAIEVPIDVRWRILPLPLVKPYILAAPVLTFPQSGNEDFEGTESLNLTADIGAGVEITLPGIGFTLMPELRYGIATSSFFEDEFEIGGTTIDPQDDPRLNSIMLRLNVKF